MHKFTAPHWATMIYRASGYLTEEFGGGPKFLKMAWVINLHKIITLFIVFGLMLHFDNFSTSAWVYLGLHGIYGYCWLGYLVLAYATVFFYSRMYVKDASISRYPEWDAYAARSSRLIPWKLFLAISPGGQSRPSLSS